MHTPPEERPFTLATGDGVVARGTCSPEQLRELAAGRLLTDGLLAERAVAAIEIADAGGTLALRVTLRARQPVPAPPLRAAAKPPATFADLFRALFRHGDERHPDGGVHVAALSDGAVLVHTATDVGRHNAVDKVLGAGLLAGAELGRLGLLLSARVSGEMARKAASAGVAWIASRSVPTSLALETATVAGITLVGRAASHDPFIWEPAQRS